MAKNDQAGTAPNPNSNPAYADKQNAAALDTKRVVTVACKLPHGCVIRDFVESVAHEPVLGGGSRKVKVYRPVGPKIRIKGPTVPAPFVRLVEVVGGYAITEGIPADVFARWMKWNEDSAPVRNKLIFGDESGDKVRGICREYASLASGVEPLDVSMIVNKDGRQVLKDPRVKRAGADLVVDGKVETAV